MALLKTKKFYIIILALAVIAGGYFYFSGKNAQVDYTLAKVERGTLRNTISETGSVEAPEDLSLGFLAAGRLKNIYFKEGERVEVGQAIADLDYGALSIKEKELAASVSAASANLDKLLSGATGEEVKVYRAAVSEAQAAHDAAIKDLKKVQNTAAENNRQAEKTLNDLTSGLSFDVTTYEQTVAQSQTSLANAKSSYGQALEAAKTNAIATIEEGILGAQTALDKIKAVLGDNDAAIYFSAKDPQYAADTRVNYDAAAAKKSFASAKLAAAEISKKETDIKLAGDASLDFLNATLKALNSCFEALERSLVSTSFTQAELDAYKTSIDAQITLVSADTSSLRTDTQSLDTASLNYQNKIREAEDDLVQAEAALANARLSAQNSADSAKLTGESQISAAQSKVETTKKSLEAANANLEKVLAGSNNYDVQAAGAALAQAQAGLESVKRQIEDNILTAPISGVVTKIKYKVGENIPANQPAASLLGDNEYNIKVDVSEIDISKISLNNQCEITFDAFGADEKFSGQVSSIDTAPTIIQDVVYYEVKVRIESDGFAEQAKPVGAETINNELARIKPGMTANVDIFAAKKDGVLFMPMRAVIDNNGEGKFVRVMRNGVPEEVPVEIGMKGDDGLVEIISGVNEGDEVVTFVKETK